jgi:hypothetical protein
VNPSKRGGVEIITELLDPHLPVGRCDVVGDVAERFPIICAAWLRSGQ